jgi:hypothetical protein
LKGDVLIVMRLDRPVRSTRDLRNILDTVAKTGAPLSGAFQYRYRGQQNGDRNATGVGRMELGEGQIRGNVRACKN